MKKWVALLLAAVGMAGTAWGGPGNQPPPAGAILDLNGLPIPGGANGSTFQQYTVTFVAVVSNTTVTFAFRDDPADVSVEEFSVTDLTVPGPNLLVNGDLTGGRYTNGGNSGTPVGWTYANQYGATSGGGVESGCGGPQAMGYCWSDGAVAAYDAITQTVPTVIGHSYQISFYVAENSGCGCNFTRLSDGSENSGIDVLAYAQVGLPAAGNLPTTPAPSSLPLLLTGLALLSGWVCRDRIHQRLIRR